MSGNFVHHNRVYKKSRQILNSSLFREAPQCAKLFLLKCIVLDITYNVKQTQKFRNLKLQHPGVVSFTTSELWLARETFNI